MTISMTADNGWTPVDIRYDSPSGKTVKGTRVKIGWLFIRIGAIILFGKKWNAQ